MTFQIQSRPLGGAQREIVLTGRLHADGADALHAAVGEALGAVHVVVFDARGLESIDAVALRVIVDGVKRGGEVVFFGLRPVVRRFFDLVGFSGLVTIHEERDDALRATP